MYTITLNDGSKIDGLTLKNNCLMSAKPLTAGMFVGKLNPVTIAGTKDDNDDEDFGELAGTHAHMEVAYIKQDGNTYRLALADIPDSTWEKMQNRADIDFLAMMNGITL